MKKIESGLPEEYYMLEGVVYMYTFPNGKVYIGRTCRDPEVCHNEHLHPTPHLCNRVENYATMHLNSKYHLYQSVASKLGNVESMSEEERKFYDKYFGEDNMFYGADIRDGFWREEYEDYALFMLEEESKQIAEEFVHENEASLLSIFFKA